MSILASTTVAPTRIKFRLIAGRTKSRYAVTTRCASMITSNIISIGLALLLLIDFIIIIDACGAGRRHPPSWHESMEA